MCDYLMWEERCKLTKQLFPVLKDCSTDKFDMRRVYPLKQREVLKVARLADTMVDVLHVWVIGSAISMKCTQESDLDLIIEVSEDCTDLRRNDITVAIQELTDWDCDILWRDHITEQDAIYSELEGGLRIK